MSYPDLLARSIEDLRVKTAAHDQLWHVSECDWTVDQDAGEIVFSAPNGTVATCAVQIIGTYHTTDSTWLWAWDNPSVHPSLRKHALRLREYGEANAVNELTTRKLALTEDECWELTALACKLNDAQGAYRGTSGATLIFMTFGEPRLSGRAGDARATVEGAPQSTARESDPEIPPDARRTLLGFITALHDWEVAAYETSQVGDSLQALKNAQTTYEALIRDWCVAEAAPQAISFSSEPSHHPKRERLVSASTSERTCLVRTQHTSSSGFVSDYQYRLRLHEGKWFVESLTYVDEDGEYELL